MKFVDHMSDYEIGKSRDHNITRELLIIGIKIKLQSQQTFICLKT